MCIISVLLHKENPLFMHCIISRNASLPFQEIHGKLTQNHTVSQSLLFPREYFVASCLCEEFCESVGNTKLLQVDKLSS